MSEISNRGFHPLLEDRLSYLFVDSCMQIWPDADFAHAHRHGVAAYAVTAWQPEDGLEQALEGAMYWHLIARQHPNIMVVDRAQDIRDAYTAGRAALLLAAQGGDFVASRLHRLEAFYRLGLRMMLPAYNSDNMICGGCLDRADSGLSAFGELVVGECNRLGLLLDCSHVSRRSSLEIMAASQDPVVYSHANSRALVDNPRNIDDEQIRACAATGGVIGLVAWGPLLLKKGATQRPTIDDLVQHLDYVVDVTGSTDHVGLGTDFSLGSYPDHASNPWGNPPYADVVGEYNRIVAHAPRSPDRFADGFSNYAQLPDLIDRLCRRGYSESDVAKILGENFLRVFERVWK